MLLKIIFGWFTDYKGLIIITWLAKDGVRFVADHAVLIDLYHKYSSGQLDNSEPTSDQYAVTGMITCALATCNSCCFSYKN